MVNVSTFNVPNVSSMKLLNGLNVATPQHSCKGNGMTLGITDSYREYGAFSYTNSNISCTTLASGTNAGTVVSTEGTLPGKWYSLGLSEDSTKSGIISVATTSTISNYQEFRGIIKY